MNTQVTTARNGVNVEALLAAREALTEAPEGARFKWRATSEWMNGTHSRSTVEGFYGLGGEQKHRQKFQFDSDHPEVFASEDKGATPVEIVLVGLVGGVLDQRVIVWDRRGRWLGVRALAIRKFDFRSDRERRGAFHEAWPGYRSGFGLLQCPLRSIPNIGMGKTVRVSQILIELRLKP